MIRAKAELAQKCCGPNAGDCKGNFIPDSDPKRASDEIDTAVAVQSGDTVLLGGLIQQNDGNTNSGVPGLKNIPLLGRLFGSSSRDTSRTELLVLITPTVVSGGAEEARELTEEYKKRFLGLEPLLKDMAEAEKAREEVD